MKNNYKIKRICCIGAGYVGGPTCAIFAYKCPEVIITVVDKSEDKINQWLSDNLPIYEPGLKEILNQCLNRNLFFSTDIKTAINESDLIFICVDTPTKLSGIGRGKAFDLTNLERAARMIADYAQEPKIVVEKSTVPVKAADTIKQIFLSYNKQWSNNSSVAIDSSGAIRSNESNQCPGHHVVISSPEFLAEGSAIHDLLYPDRILIGVDESCSIDRYGLEVLRHLYCHWISNEKIIVMSTWSSELSKLAANAFLAQRISSINSLSAICEASGADIRDVSRAVGLDSRIGGDFLQASIGFGGSCFKKDVLNLVYLSECLQMPEVARYWQSVIDLNDYQKKRCINRIFKGLLETVTNKKIAIWGFAFKKNTKDTRNSAAIDICKYLLEEQAILSIYDPKVEAQQIFKELNITNDSGYFSHIIIEIDALSSTINAHAIVLCTEWDEFKSVDFSAIFPVMQLPKYIFDGRNILNHQHLRSMGFQVEAVGIYNHYSNHNHSNNSRISLSTCTNSCAVID